MPILETYLKHANISGYFEREARTVWALFRSLCDKPLKDADRDDGRKLVAYFESRGLKSATIAKKVGWLTAACNLAIKEGRLKFNPFASIVPARNDGVRRLPLSDADMRLVKRNLDKLTDFDQKLFPFSRGHGHALLERGILEIDGEMKERGVRVCHSRQKDRTIALRRVPLPTCALPYLPKDINGRLFLTSSTSIRRIWHRNAWANSWMTSESTIRARWSIHCGIVRKIDCAPPSARKIFDGRS